MSLPVLRERILHSLIDSPQLTARAEQAIKQLGEGLAALAGMGHLMHVEPGAGPDLSEWPRQVYHLELAPKGRHCATVWDFWDLGEDWFFTLQEAQLSSGLKAQNAGRGGIFRSGLPAVTVDVDVVDHSADYVARAKAEFLANKGN